MNKYPEGKLNEQDEGQLPLLIGIEDNCVVIKFPKLVAWVGMSKEDALILAYKLIEKSELIQPETKQ